MDLGSLPWRPEKVFGDYCVPTLVQLDSGLLSQCLKGSKPVKGNLRLKHRLWGLYLVRILWFKEKHTEKKNVGFGREKVEEGNQNSSNRRGVQSSWK